MAERYAEEVSELLRRAVGAGGAIGFSALANSTEGEGLYWCVGEGAVGGETVDPTLWYDLASLTKPLATATLLLLARRDGLDLDAPVSEVLDELVDGPWRNVTFVQCASHVAGFPAWEPLYTGGVGGQAYLQRINTLKPIAPAGVRVEYSCIGYVVLGLALERAADCDLATLFDELIATPLGLSDGMGFKPTHDRCVAGGELNWFVEKQLLADRGLLCDPPESPKGVIPCDDGNARGLQGAAGNAGLFGNVAAVAALASEYLPGGGELLDAEEAQLTTRCLTVGLEQARGLGWQLAASPDCSAGPAQPPAAFGHAGFTGTSVWVDPEAGLVFVLLGNRLHPGGRTPDFHPLRRRFHMLSKRALSALSIQRVNQ